MNVNEYLEKILAEQNLPDDSAELKELQERRADVEKLLRTGFPESKPTIRYGGSKAKGTLIREAYDLDITCYFRHDDTGAGKSLRDIFTNVKGKLSEKYFVKEKTSAIRLKSKDSNDFARDFHIDVVPGRFVDEFKSDCFLHQEGVDKERLKTNLDTHIAHVRDSGIVPAIRLLKLWKTRRTLRIKQFVFELLITKLLKDKKDRSLAAQLEYIFKELRGSEEPIAVEDPANPSGNDLSPLLKVIWPELSSFSDTTMDLIKNSGWEAVFGQLDNDENSEKIIKLKQAAAGVATPTKPWFSYK
jgi:hypothetical protein